MPLAVVAAFAELFIKRRIEGTILMSKLVGVLGKKPPAQLSRREAEMLKS
jgi:hypothetical protein